MNWDLLIKLTVLSFVQDQLTTNCKKVTIETQILSLGHHFFSIWLFFAPLVGFTNYRFHLVTAILIFAGWKYYGTCLWTKKYNELCGIKGKSRHRDLVYRFNEATGISHREVMFALIFWDIYNICFK